MMIGAVIPLMTMIGTFEDADKTENSSSQKRCQRLYNLRSQHRTQERLPSWFGLLPIIGSLKILA